MTNPDTRADGLWERLAQDIHAHGYSVRDALAAWRPAIEAEAAAPYREALDELLKALDKWEAGWQTSRDGYGTVTMRKTEARALLAAEVASSDAGMRREVGDG